MKTKKEILEQKYNIDESTISHNYQYLYRSMLEAMNDYGKQCYLEGHKDEDKFWKEKIKMVYTEHDMKKAFDAGMYFIHFDNPQDKTFDIFMEKINKQGLSADDKCNICNKLKNEHGECGCWESFKYKIRKENDGFL